MAQRYFVWLSELVIPNSVLVTLSIHERRYSWFVRDMLVRQLAVDDKFIYWPQNQPYAGPNKPEHGAIVRLPLDYTPVLNVDPAPVAP
jgi:hypothetical protein